MTFSAYPNPTQGLVTVQVAQAESFDYAVYNLQGQLLLQGNVQGDETTLNLASFPEGIYLIAVTANNQQPVYQRIIR
jgi:hypothetical protein